MRDGMLGWVKVSLVVVGLMMPTAAVAQSAIAGTVTDTTGAVLPGVTVEARSPALIEQLRTGVTDDQGSTASSTCARVSTPSRLPCRDSARWCGTALSCPRTSPRR